VPAKRRKHFFLLSLGAAFYRPSLSPRLVPSLSPARQCAAAAFHPRQKAQGNGT